MRDSDKVDIVLKFGKFKGEKISDVPSKYLGWILDEYNGNKNIIEGAKIELKFRDLFDCHI